MPDDLRRQLGRTSVEGGYEGGYDPHPVWGNGVWRRAVERIAAGRMLPETRFPVIINPDGPLSSPEKLQELARLDSVPKTWCTKQVTEWMPPNDFKGPDAVDVVCCDVNEEELDRLKEAAETDFFEVCVLFNDQQRFATRVHTIKDADGRGSKRKGVAEDEPASAAS